MNVITASEANRQFSKVLRDVSRGETITVVSRGKAVATISLATSSGVRRNAAKKRLLERLGKQTVTGVRAWSRGELYD
ncbi:MAG TPA: type II toxin-antitoxin system prevent-host-death family antitoxin [Dissulfurispiraceae bacterium]|nr:type II toxin-antitoxin system prevent-host-death family antitoxin [Dissulfurispiraceae bacterium]